MPEKRTRVPQYERVRNGKEETVSKHKRRTPASQHALNGAHAAVGATIGGARWAGGFYARSSYRVASAGFSAYDSWRRKRRVKEALERQERRDAAHAFLAAHGPEYERVETQRYQTTKALSADAAAFEETFERAEKFAYSDAEGPAPKKPSVLSRAAKRTIRVARPRSAEAEERSRSRGGAQREAGDRYAGGKGSSASRRWLRSSSGPVFETGQATSQTPSSDRDPDPWGALKPSGAVGGKTLKPEGAIPASWVKPEGILATDPIEESGSLFEELDAAPAE